MTFQHCRADQRAVETEGFPAVKPQPWMEEARCVETDPDAFFPLTGGSTREAKRVCMGCEVRDKCLAYALENEERFGVWGGYSERERRRLNRGEQFEPAIRKQPTPIPKQCVWCGNDFLGWGKQRYCGIGCREYARRQRKAA